MKCVTVNTVLAALIVLTDVSALNILGIFPYEGKSHFYVFKPYLEELAKRGHNLTVISHFPQKSSVNYHDINLAGEALDSAFPISRSYWVFVQISLFLANSGSENCRTLLANSEVQNLWKTNAKYDLIVVEQFNSDCSLGLAHQLGAPVIGITSHTLMAYHYNRVGISYNPSYMRFQLFEGESKPTLYQRIERLLGNTYINLVYKYMSQRRDENTLRQYFKDIPPVEELGKKIKLFLLYQYNALTGPASLPTNIKEVGGFHVAKPKPLPKHLEKFIEEAEHGVILISFGTMLKPSSMPQDKLKHITAAISELPQRIIWKWDEINLPGNPTNIHVASWLPQNDILAHPKVLAFYSHCGMLGTTEALHHGIPIIGMPITGDQPSNAGAVQESGMGVTIHLEDLTKDLLLEKIKTVLDPAFQERAKQISGLWHDRPLSAMDSAIYWTEFAARNKNFTFSSPVIDVPFYQYYYLDLISIFLAIILTFIFVINLITKVKNKTPQIRKVAKKTKYQ